MKRIFLIFVLACPVILLNAQVADFFNYQAVVRNSSGEIIANSDVSFRLSILLNSSEGETSYSEIHSAKTNDFGLVNLAVGKGTPQVGSFSMEGWGNAKRFLKVECDPGGSDNFLVLTTTELASVPYAFHAYSTETGDNW